MMMISLQLKKSSLLLPLLLLLSSTTTTTVVHAFNYGLTGEISEDGGIKLTDEETGITDIKTLFVDEITLVKVEGVEWAPSNGTVSSNDFLRYETLVGGVVQATGVYNLSTLDERELLTTVECGNVTVSTSGTHKITVNLYVDNTTTTTSDDYQAYAAGVAIIPLLVVLVLALATQMVEVSLFCAIFVGACMVEGNIKDGFKTTLDDYILNAVANADHAYVYLFTLFLSGMVGMMEKIGGMLGFTHAISKYAKTSRAGQFATFCIGCVVFFDDYANTLLAGETMRPLTDLLYISREKLAFIVDATAAPIASIVPISSWVGFEVGLIQTEIDKIVAIYGEENVTIQTSALGVFLQSIKYRYYPIFMLILIPLLIFSMRDFGPMLIAERRTQVYQRQDGGDGGGKADKGKKGTFKENQPRPDTPKKSWNMLIPICLLIFFIFYLLVMTGDDGSGTQSFMDKIESSDSYSALLWGTMAAAILSLILYLIQIVQDGRLVLPTFAVLRQLLLPKRCQRNANASSNSTPDGSEEDKEIKVVKNDGQQEEAEDAEDDAASTTSSEILRRHIPRPLMSLYESVESMLYGMGRIFPALIVLTLAWASGAIMIAVGADRLFARWIVGGVSAAALPTLSFVISGFMALATGTSWGTMTILFPLICVPAYEVSGGDPIIFYATVAGILSGSVAGDHMSPISDTTVLSALASDCKLINHVMTQAPYALIISLFAILLGTVPIGAAAWPNIVGILLGAFTILLFTYIICVPVLSPTGRFDVCTKLYLMCKGRDSPLYELAEDTSKASQRTTSASNEDDDDEVKDLNKNNGTSKGGDDGNNEPNDYTEPTEFIEPSMRKNDDNNGSDNDNPTSGTRGIITDNISEVSDSINV